jgi:Flp pilus assembly pilin Flp
MRNFVLKTMLRLRNDERGVTLVEYGIAIALAITLGAGALMALAGDIGGAMQAAGGAMPGTSIGTATYTLAN